jgi:hypothetical protein
MKAIASMFVLLFFGLVAHAQDYVEIANTSHFLIKKRSEIPLTEADAKILLSTLESGYQKILLFLGDKADPQSKFTVLLEGEGLPNNKMPNYPSVDSKATIRLYSFPGPGAAFLQGLPHELVHAFRNDLRKYHESVDDYLKGYGFIEEGFAEFVTTTVEPSNQSFPRYGFPLEIVVGYWFSNNTEIPLDVLFNHHEMNPSCIAQAYPLRASFFEYLYHAYGREKVFSLAYYAKPYSINVFDEIFNKSFEVLNEEWKSWAQMKFVSFKNNDSVLKFYAEKTYIKYFPVCSKGKDW